MGDVVSNVGTPTYHVNKQRQVLGIRAEGHHLGVGQPWVAPPEIPVSTYSPIHGAALQTQAAFDAAVAASPWASWYANTLPADCREAWRAGCAVLPPRDVLPLP